MNARVAEWRETREDAMAARRLLLLSFGLVLLLYIRNLLAFESGREGIVHEGKPMLRFETFMQTSGSVGLPLTPVQRQLVVVETTV